MKHDFLYVIWKNPKSRKNYTVGKLTKLDGYLFEYSNEYKDAQQNGWELIKAFPEVKEYQSKELFPFFSSRLPDKKRRNIKEILKRYNLEEYDGYELLRKSGGRLPIDTYEFIDPIFPDDEVVKRDFYICGVRHTAGCKGENCTDRQKLHVDMELLLELEPDNEHDSNAVLVKTEQGESIGYVPRYYSESLATRLMRDMSYECKIIELCKEKDCQNCIKVKLEMPRNNN